MPASASSARVAMQRRPDRAWSARRPVDAGRRHHAERAEARRRLAERVPRSGAAKTRDRGLAVGAGDGGDRSRLRRDKSARRQAAGRAADCASAMIGTRPPGSARGRGLVGQDRHGAAGDGIGDEASRRRLVPAQRGKQEARPHGANVGGRSRQSPVRQAPAGRRQALILRRCRSVSDANPPLQARAG